MVVFSRPEGSKWLKGCDERFVPKTGVLGSGYSLCRSGDFFVVATKDSRAVGIADVVSLAVECGWVVYTEEIVVEFCGRGLVFVIRNFNGFGMSGVRFVGWVFVASSGVADDGAQYPGLVANELL